MAYRLSIEDVKYIVFRVTNTYLEWDEPIPDFETRYEGILESCLGQPFQSYGGIDLYPTLSNKAAILFYSIIKNHPFRNGNKRIATITLLVFLWFDKKWLSIDNESIYKFAIQVAQSDSKDQKRTLEIIKSFIEEHLIDT